MTKPGRTPVMRRRVVLAVHIEESWRAVLGDVAREQDRSVSSIVRLALAESELVGDRLPYEPGYGDR